MIFLPNAVRDDSRLHHLLQRLLGLADGAHAVMDAARTETALRDLEAAAFAEQDVFLRHANVFQQNLGVTVRRVVKAKHRQHLLHLDAGGIERNEDLRLRLVLRRIRIGLAHQDRDLAAGIADARRPPFAAVDDVVIAILFDAGFDIGRVRRRNCRFRHQEGGADLAVHQRPQPLPLLLLGAVADEHFHVAGIGSGAIEHLRGPGDATHLFRQQRIFEVGQSRTTEFVVFMRIRRHEHVPEAFGLRLLLQVLEDRDHLPARALRILLVVDRNRGADMRLHERLHAVQPFLLLF